MARMSNLQSIFSNVDYGFDPTPLACWGIEGTRNKSRLAFKVTTLQDFFAAIMCEVRDGNLQIDYEDIRTMKVHTRGQETVVYFTDIEYIEEEE